MKYNQKQIRPQKKPRKQQKNKIKQNQKKNGSTYCTRKCIYIYIYNIKKTCCQEGKRQETPNNLPSLHEGERETKCQLKQKYFGTMLLPLLTWLIQTLPCKNGFCSLDSVALCYNGFSENLSILKSPSLAKSRRATKKHKNEGRANTNDFCHFSRSLVVGFCSIMSRP